jgi:hypothetical protein
MVKHVHAQGSHMLTARTHSAIWHRRFFHESGAYAGRWSPILALQLYIRASPTRTLHGFPSASISVHQSLCGAVRWKEINCNYTYYRMLMLGPERPQKIIYRSESCSSTTTQQVEASFSEDFRLIVCLVLCDSCVSSGAC